MPVSEEYTVTVWFKSPINIFGVVRSSHIYQSVLQVTTWDSEVDNFFDGSNYTYVSQDNILSISSVKNP